MMFSLSSPPRTTTLFLIGCSLALSACASNSDRRGPPERGERSERPARTSGTFLRPASAMFAAMDLDRDKVVTREEMLEGVKSEWLSFGGNPSAAKFSSWSIQTLGSTDASPTFMSFDRDFNQVVTSAEFSNEIERLFTQYDKNGDGAIERSEMIIAVDAPRGRSRGEQSRGQGGRGQGGGGGRPPR